MALTSSAISVLAISIIFPLLTIIFVGLRFWARNIKSVRYGIDDWFAVVSVFLCIAMGIDCVYGVATHAIGREVTVLTQTEFISFQKILFVNPIFTCAALSTVKLCVLFFYKRIFAVSKPFRAISNVLIVICILWFIASVLCQIFEQFPISDNWTTDLTGGHTHFILDYGRFLMAYSAIDLVLDIVILSMPLFIIRTLHLNTRRKIVVTGIFSLGFITIIAECVRIYQQWVFLYQPNTSIEVIYKSTLTQILIWSTIEPCVSLIAACLPTFGPIFMEGRSTESLIRSVRSFLSIKSAARSTRNLQKSGKESEDSSANNNGEGNSNSDMGTRA